MPRLNTARESSTKRSLSIGDPRLVIADPDVIVALLDLRERAEERMSASAPESEVE